MRALTQGVPVDSADAALNAMVEEVADRLQASDPVDLEAIAQHSPERIAILRQLLPAIEMMADLGRSLIRNSARTGSPAAGQGQLGVLGDFRIVREIGRGGMGVVYAAEQVSLGRKVALKVLPFAVAVDPKLLARFHVEAQAAAHLHHTNIVPIYSVGCENGLNYYAMQYIDGPSLAAVIRELRRRTRTKPAEQSPAGSDCAVGLAEDMISGHFVSPRPGTAAVNARPTQDYQERQAGPQTAGSARGTTKARPSLGRAYYQAAAHLGAQAAEALDHAHRTGVVHRDIKPGNLLVDARGKLWVTDFGLARMSDQSDLTLTGDLVGTLRFMSPEQAHAKRIVVDDRTDIYSLGVTLYELLTLEPAFNGRDRQELLRQIACEEPRAPRRIDPAIPVELETIVLKAMNKDPNGRYATARDLAADLRRFLEYKPIEARPPTLLERADKWSRRHRGLVAAGLVLLLSTAVISTTAATFIAQEQQKTAAAERASRLESLSQQILRTRLMTHHIGWSDYSWDLIRQAARLAGRRDGNLQTVAVGTLQGLDARVVNQFTDFGVASMMFDASGRRLLMGGCTDPKDRSRGRLPAKLWDTTTQRLHELRGDARGPVGFLPDGTPVQLVAGKVGAPIVLVNLDDGQTIRSFQTGGSLIVEDGDVLSTAMMADGSLAGAAVKRPDGGRALAVWDGITGRLLKNLKTDVRCLAFAPDRSLVAGGDAMGRITIWSLASGQELTHIQCGRTRVNSLSLTRERRTRAKPGEHPALDGWLLAAGVGGGEASVWDLGAGVRRGNFPGGHYDIYSVAFSPDATLLAATGRYFVTLWDIAGNRPVLRLDGRVRGADNYIRGLAFAPNGKTLAVGSEAVFGWPCGASLVELKDGRGVQTLRGLTGDVEKVAFSADGRLVAALANDWQVGVWDRGDGLLLRVFEAPVGLFADQATLAFSPDGRHFAFSAGQEARLWDLATGAQKGAWTLPPALSDRLAFHDPDNLLLIRQETTDGVSPPGNRPVRDQPRIVRLRRLLADGRMELVREIKDYPAGLLALELTPDGAYVVIGGWSNADRKFGSLQFLEARTGTPLWSRPVGADLAYRLDPTGKIFVINDYPIGAQPSVMVEVPTGKFLGTFDPELGEVGPGVRRWIRRTHPTRLSHDHRLLLMEQGRHDPLLQIDPDLVDGGLFFNSDGGHAAWGRTDGIVAVLDFHEIQRRLAEVDLGW